MLGSPWAQWQVGNYVRMLSGLLVAAVHIMSAGMVTALTCDLYRKTPSVEGLQTEPAAWVTCCAYSLVVLVRIQACTCMLPCSCSDS